MPVSMRQIGGGVFLAFCMTSCSAEAPAHDPPAVAPPHSEATSVPTATPAMTQVPSASESPTREVSIPFERVLEGGVHSIGFGEKRKAALGYAAAWIEEGGKWTAMPKPPADTSGSRIFFGRDDQPRIMGGANEELVYLRFKNGAWKRGDEEIAGLASAPKLPLYGVIGHADPEVVCKMNGGCIVKRRSGWKLFESPAHSTLPWVELCGAQPWAAEDAEVWKVTDTGFVPFAANPTFNKAQALWAIADDDIWVVQRAPASIHHFDGSKWQASPSPVGGPRAVWASGKGDVWIAGDGGAARFDGQAWSKIGGLPKGLLTVTGQSASDVWIGGEAGLYRRSKN